jgi:hypothetical protein
MPVVWRDGARARIRCVDWLPRREDRRRV